MKQSLNLKLSQQLTLTPQLKQSLKLLQLPSSELELEIQQTLDTNPLLERVEQEVVAVEPIQSHEPAQDNGIPQPVAEAADPSFEIEQTDHLAPEQDLALNWQESFESNRAYTNSSSSHATSDVEFTHYAVKQETLFEHLDWQIQMTSLNPQDKLIARTLLHCLDQDGYLVAELSEVVTILSNEIEVEQDEVAAMLSLVKSLEPIGVGAANLSERLSMLLANQPEESLGLEAAKLIVEKHIDLLATRNLAKLKKELNISDSGLSNALNLITQLNPRIGSQFQSDAKNHVTPDVLVKKVSNAWVAQLNPESQTKLRVNTTYSDLLKSDQGAASGLDKEGSDYIQQNLLECSSRA